MQYKPPLSLIHSFPLSEEEKIQLSFRFSTHYTTTLLTSNFFLYLIKTKKTVSSSTQKYIVRVCTVYAYRTIYTWNHSTKLCSLSSQFEEKKNVEKIVQLLPFLSLLCCCCLQNAFFLFFLFSYKCGFNDSRAALATTFCSELRRTHTAHIPRLDLKWMNVFVFGQEVFGFWIVLSSEWKRCI